MPGPPLWTSAQDGRADEVGQLLADGADIEETGTLNELETQCTPLWIAVFKGHTACVRLLLEKGANVSFKVDTGRTPLHAAARYPYSPESAVRMLVEWGQGWA